MLAGADDCAVVVAVAAEGKLNVGFVVAELVSLPVLLNTEDGATCVFGAFGPENRLLCFVASTWDV